MAEIIGISDIGITSNSLDMIPNTNGNEYGQVVHDNFQIYPKKLGITPEDASNGVYVYANDGLLYEPDSWYTGRNDEAVGVAVVTDNSRFCIGKGEKLQIAWSTQLYGTDVPGVTNATSSTNDYKGQSNTIAIIAAATLEDASNNAAHYCYSQTISVNGSTIHGYLPSIGELNDAYKNKSNVDSVINLIEGTVIPIENGVWLWSSSEYNGRPTDDADTLRWNDGFVSSDDKNYSNRYAIPVFPLLPTLVDLGLPSGTLWSPTNLGAFKPEQSGYYYQWGDTIGWTKKQVGTDKIFNWANYKWSINGSNTNFSKYNSTDGKTVLDLEDDAVHITLGGNWKMPTVDDWRELYNNTSRQWIQINGVNGYKLTASNGNYIFLPAAGRGNGSSLNNEGSSGYVWSSSLYSVGSPSAFGCLFNSGGFSPDNSNSRCYGFSVRGIYKQTI